MGRAIFEAVLLFVLPFVLYGAWAWMQRRFGINRPSWAQGRVGWLAALGLALVLVALVSYGATSRRGKGAYVPAHMDGGRLIPGRIQ